MKNGVQAGKIRPAIIGEIDVTFHPVEVNRTILTGINSYLSGLTNHMPPVVFRADKLEDITLIQ